MKLFKKQDKEAKAKSQKPDKGTDDGGPDGKKKRGGSGEGIQTLFANHVEKMVFGVAVLGALFLAFKGFMGRTAIENDLAPHKLQQQAQQASTKVNSFSWNEFKAERDREKNFLERSNETQEKVAANNYSIGQLIMPPYAPAKTLRTDPVILAARDLRVLTGYGPLLVKNRRGETVIQPRDPNAPQRLQRDLPWQQWVVANGDQTRGVYFNAITALIPYAEQVAEFAKLKNAEGYDPERDQPKYLRWALFREEAIPGQGVKKKVITLANLARLEANWGGHGENTLDPPKKFIHEKLTCTVPPILINDLPRFTTHPGIPREIPEKRVDGYAELPDDPPPVDETDPFRFSYTEGQREAETPLEGGPESELAVGEAPPEYLLFRYFDTEVSPGRTYRYSLLLQLDDPNRPEDGTPPSPDTLDQSVAERLNTSKRSRGVTSPKSAPSAAVTVGSGGRVIAGEVAAAERVSVDKGASFARDEPSATIMATTFLPKTGASIPVVETVHRGSVANYKKSVWYWPPKGNRAFQAEDQVILTNSTIFDIRGGTNLADTGLKAPGRLLVFDRNGQMTVIDELEDATIFESTRVPEPELETRPEENVDTRRRTREGRPDDLLEGGPRRRERANPRGNRARGQRNR